MLVCSILSVAITFGIFIYVLFNNKLVNEANYHDKNSYIVQTYVREHGAQVIDPSFKEQLEKNAPIGDIKYEITDKTGSIIYGNTTEKLISSQGDLITKINTTSNESNIITRYVPLFDNEGNLLGSFVVKYPIKVTIANNSNTMYSYILLIFLASPFIFIIIYSLIFGSKFAKNINKPLTQLIDASNKIKTNDLDFEINYPYTNELGEVIDSYNSMRRELKKTLNKHWQLEQERKDMVSALSHDLKTPLTIIKGHVELLQEGSYKNEDRLKKYLGIIENNADRASHLVEDLNVISKIENIDFQLNYTNVNLSEFLAETALEYKTLCERKKVTFILNKENVYDVAVKFDKLRISQVLGNIFTNSLRFTPENGVIKITASLNGTHLYFSVEDNGKGFNKEDLNNIFSKFYQGDKSRSEEKGHSGLGLYICKILVEKHGGEIFASNNDDGGARIEFFLILE